ncbi:MAG: hypothetical protein N3A38_04230 [Planctomycetota bacterium]|nr:hypothetical protein [Planctomycetota bacterium]
MISLREIVAGFAVRIVAVAALGFCCGCEWGRTSPQPYSIVRIEMRYVDNKVGNNEEYDETDVVNRIRSAGRSVVPELAYALDSGDKKHIRLARKALRLMTEVDGWDEAYDFVYKRLTKFSLHESGALLYAIDHRGVADYPHMLRWVPAYLDDDKNHVMTVLVNSPNNRVDMRVCDFAASVIRWIVEGNGEDLGLPSVFSNDDRDKVLEKVREWVDAKLAVKEAPNIVEYRVPREWIERAEARRRAKAKKTTR